MTLLPTSKLFTEFSAISEVGQSVTTESAMTKGTPTRVALSRPHAEERPQAASRSVGPPHPSRRPRCARAPQDEAKRMVRLRLRDELGVEVGAEPFDTALAAVTRLLDAAERRLGRRDCDRVDAHHAAFDGVADCGCGRVRGRKGVGCK